MPIGHQLLRFLVTGGLATALQYLTLAVCSITLGWTAWLGSGMGYLLGSILSYVMNYFFTFDSKRPHSQAAPRFYLMVAIGWTVNTLTVAAFADGLNWNTWISQLIATTLTLAWNFSAARIWVFKLN